MEKVKKFKKILFIFVFASALFIFSNLNKTYAATYQWPVGGDNLGETYVEYGYGTRNYDSDSYNNKYNYAPYERYYKATENHYGIDIVGIKGHTYSIVSASNGRVVGTSANRYYNPSINFIDRNLRMEQEKGYRDGGGYGNYIIIEDTSTGKCFLYGHLRAGTIKVKRGDTVKMGQVIATMGSSGDSGHQHLHFEVLKSRASITDANGGSLVSKTGYNRETENPLNYVSKPTQAKLTSVKYKFLDQKTKLEIYLNFDNEVSVKTAPTVNATVGNTIKTASYKGLNSSNKQMTFEINVNDFFSAGDLKINCTNDGQVFTKAEQKNKVACKFDNTKVCTINKLTIHNKYGGIIKNNLGDVNKDTKINVRDCAILLRLQQKCIDRTITYAEKELLLKFDFNNDKKINNEDIKLLTEFVQKVPEFNMAKLRSISMIDVNEDQIVDDKDCAELLFAVNKKQFNKKYDVNNDGQVNIRDVASFATVLKKYGTR